MAPRVLFTASTYSHIEHFHLPYLREFRDRGWETHIACAGAPAAAPYADRTFDVPFHKSISSPENFKAARMLRRLEKEEEYDLISAHTSLAAFFTRLALKGIRNRPKLVNVVHGYLFDEATPGWKKRLLLNAERLTAPQTDLLLTMNEWDYQAAEKYRLCGRIEKIPGIGVDFSRLDSAAAEDGEALRREYGIPADAFVLIYAAEFSGRKSQGVLIEAMRYLPENVVLVLAGTGALLDDCKTLAARYELGNRVLFPGYIPDMAPWYRAADAAASASRSEGLPFNIMEAMYCGLPVAASAVKGHVDLIDDGVTGLLYPYGDAAACAERVRRLAEAGELRNRLAAGAKRRAVSYGLERVFPVVSRCYASLFETSRDTLVEVKG